MVKKMQKVTVYTKNNCVQCMMTKKTLAQYGVNFEEHNVQEEPAAMSAVKALGFQAVPVIVAEGFEPVQGFRPDFLKNLAKETM
ncbi:glutaredoxin-like protein NrdH [Weissella halotolerans]